MSSARIVLSPFFAALAVAAVMNCISRDNYWDPVNYTVVLQKKLLATIDSAYGLLALDSLYRLRDSLNAINAHNARLGDSNTVIRLRNDATEQDNQAAEVANKNLRPPSSNFTWKKYLDYLLMLRSGVPVASLQPLKNDVLREKERADSVIAAANARAPEVVVFTERQRDSLLARYDILIALIDATEAQANTLSALVVRVNTDTIVPYNALVDEKNRASKGYNDSMVLALAIKVIPNNPDSVITILRNAVAGDRFLLPNGNVELRTLLFNNSGTVDSPIVITGQDSTRFNLSDVVLNGNSYITFNTIVFFGSSEQSVLVSNGCTGIVFNNCQFGANNSKGLVIRNSNVTLNDCSLRSNGDDAVTIVSTPAQSWLVSLNNVLVVNNGGHAINVNGSRLSLQNVTIANHDLQAVYVADSALDLTVTNSLFTNNCGKTTFPAIYYATGYTGVAPLSITTTNLFQNGAGKDTVNAPVSTPLLHYDPMYLDNDFSISPRSPLDSLEKAGTVIGYRKK